MQKIILNYLFAIRADKQEFKHKLHEDPSVLVYMMPFPLL